MRQISRQLWILGVALILWTLWGELSLWAALASYLGAWVLFNWGGWSKLQPPEAPRPVALAAVLLLLAGPLLAIAGRARALAIREGIHGIGEHLHNRLRLEQRPAIAPPLVVADAPQVFHVHAPKAGRVKVSFGGEALAALDLGHGLFRVAYDPRRDGPPRGPARIIVDDKDDEIFERDVAVVERAAHPRWLVADPARGVAAAVSEETDTLYLLERSGHLRSVPVGDGPADVALFDGGRRAVVAHRHEAALHIVDVEAGAGAGQKIARLPWNPFVARLAISGSGRLLAASTDSARRGVIVAELPDAHPIAFAPLPWTPDWLTFADDDTLVVAVREPRALVRLARRGDRWEPVGDLLPIGRPVVAATRRPGAPRWILATTAYRPDGGMPEGNHFVQDQLLTVDLARFTVVDQLLTARGDGRQDEPGNVESGASPMGLDLREDGSLLVAFAGTDEVWRLPADGHLPEVIFDARRPGFPMSMVAPHGVADLGEGRVAVTSPAAGTLAVLEGDGRLVALHRVAPADDELAARDPAALARRQGERGFYEATRSGVSCQSCHLHGAHDHSAHDITSRGKEISVLKGTLSTLGIAGTAPYLRGGNFPHIGDLDDVARDRYQGYRRAAADRPALLEAFVNALPLPLNPRALPQEGERLDVDRERRGVAAFVKARCDLCHAFPAFTNLGQHPARALFPRFTKIPDGAALDTPSLLGLWSSAPYLVDGRAATLDAVLREHNPDNRHGDTAALSDPEIADLVHFLESL